MRICLVSNLRIVGRPSKRANKHTRFKLGELAERINIPTEDLDLIAIGVFGVKAYELSKEQNVVLRKILKEREIELRKEFRRKKWHK